MRILRILVTTASAAALAAAFAAPAAATGDVHYAGTFGPEILGSCTSGDLTSHEASGTWRVNLHDKSAVGRFVINLDGTPEVAYTAAMDVLTPPAGATFKVHLTTLAGDLYVTLTGTDLSYSIPSYNSTTFLGDAGSVCTNVVYQGTLTEH